MSINHFSTDLPETLWWTPPPPTPPRQQTQIMEPPLISQLYHHNQLGKSPYNFNLNQNDDERHSDDRDDRQNDGAVVDPNNNSNHKIASELRDSINTMIQKETMFEKPLTPSDVGKLNRLVIPKQHAEKYFPIGGTGNNGGGGESVEKGVLLSFEDESGRGWRFRYSYWNSSQSYVLTKGWSRFVKEKRLDAGDVVMFERQVNDNEHFFIGWRRRNAVQQTLGEVAGGGVGGGWAPMVYPPPHNMQQYTAAATAAGLGAAGGGNMQNQTRGSGNSKTVRLFGVNLECQSDEVDGTSQAQARYHHHHSTSHLQNHMNINFARNVNQMRFHQG